MSSEPRVTSSPTPQPALSDEDLDAIEWCIEHNPTMLAKWKIGALVSALRAERTENEHRTTRNQVAIRLLQGQLEREAATSQQLRAALAELLDWPFEFVPEQGFGEVLMNARAVLAVESPQAKDTHES